MQLRSIYLIVLLLSSVRAAAEPSFRPIEVPQHSYEGGWEHFVGGGLAVFDCDGDALPELYAAGGSKPARLLRNESVRGGKVKFRESTPGQLLLLGVTGSYPLDINGDGYADLAVMRAGKNILLRGDGRCGFTPFEGLGFVSGQKWTTSFSARWETGSKLPTLAFGNYVDRSHPDGPFRACDTNLLYRPVGSRYSPPHVLSPGYCALSMLFSDWGRNGRADLRVSNDRHYYVDDGHEQLWAMDAAPRLYAEKDGWATYRIWGMGIASRDVSGDGLPDVYLTSMADQKLQILEDANAPAYRNAAFDMGATAHRPFVGGDGRPSTGWHVQFGDVQNDGRDDIFISKGNVDQMPASAMLDPNNLLIGQSDGSFVEKGHVAGLASMHRGRGAAVADFNLDGLLDIAVVNRRAPLEVFRNVTTNPGNWVSLKLRQGGGNVDAIGAWIELRTRDGIRSREVTIGGGHAGGVLGPEHFGIGKAEAAEIRVIWPDGNASGWQSVSPNQMLLVRRVGSKLEISDY